MRQFFKIMHKEWLDIFRSKGMVIFIFYIFLIDVYIAGQGINIDAKNVNVGILDEKGDSVYVNKIVSKLHQPEFKDIIYYKSRKKLYEDIKNRKIMVGIAFAHDFDRHFADNKPCQIQLLLDSTVATISYFTYYYLSNIISDFQVSEGTRIPIELDIHKLFNPNANPAPFFSLRELIYAVTLLSLILSASVFVKEREQGTWDLMLLMPVDNKIVILAKILSQVIVINIGFFISMGIVIFGVFNVHVHGSLLAFFVLTFLYSIALCGVGLFIAAIAKNIAQVGMMSILALIPMDFLSEGFTPISQKPLIIQWLSYLSPMRYFTIAMSNLIFRGTDVIYLWNEFLGVTIIAIFFFIYGVRKIGRLF
jgi:ABC-2 type transport system permease protein